MVAKPWRQLTHWERRKRLDDALENWERRRQHEPEPETSGEYWDSAGYLQAASLLAYSVLETDGQMKPPPGATF